MENGNGKKNTYTPYLSLAIATTKKVRRLISTLTINQPNSWVELIHYTPIFAEISSKLPQIL